MTLSEQLLAWAASNRQRVESQGFSIEVADSANPEGASAYLDLFGATASGRVTVYDAGFMDAEVISSVDGTQLAYRHYDRVRSDEVAPLLEQFTAVVSTDPLTRRSQ